MHTVIIGSGVAGWTLARELRKLQADAEAHPITLICADSGDFYSKPMLSNAFAGKKTAAQLLMTPVAKIAEQQKVIAITNTRVTRINTTEQFVEHAQGQTAYDQLVLALGADPIRLPIEGSGAADILSVNDLHDYARFRERLDTLGDQAKVAILGAGLIGCEFANDILAAGHEVTVYDIAPLPLGRLLPPAAGEYMKEGLTRAGVQWKLQTSAQSVEKTSPDQYLVTDNHGDTVAANIVLSAVGLHPRTALAKDNGIATHRGIIVNKQGQTNVPNIYALGDCAEYGDTGQGLVLPYILPVMQAARAMAQTLAGTPTAIAFPAMPVMVKTPACAAVVSAPANPDDGQWHIEPIENGLRALFKKADGSLHGLALLGEASKERQTYASQLPAVWA